MQKDIQLHRVVSTAHKGVEWSTGLTKAVFYTHMYVTLNCFQADLIWLYHTFQCPVISYDRIKGVELVAQPQNIVASSPARHSCPSQPLG